MKKIIFSLCFFSLALIANAQNMVSTSAAFLTGSSALTEFNSDKYDIGKGVGNAMSAEVSLNCEIFKLNGNAIVLGLGYKSVTASNQIFDGSEGNALDLTLDFLPIQLQINEYFGNQKKLGSYVGLSYLQLLDSEIRLNNSRITGLSAGSMFGMELGLMANLGPSSYFVGMNFLSTPFSKKDIQLSGVNIEFGINLNLFSFSKS